jgi:hypothetical protein
VGHRCKMIREGQRQPSLQEGTIWLRLLTVR